MSRPSLSLYSGTLPASGAETQATPEAWDSFPLPSASSAELSTLTAAGGLLPPYTHEPPLERTASTEAAVLKERLAREKTAHALQRANAEQARRVADSLRACHELLLQHLAQPCFVLNRDGEVIRWNPAMTTWSGLDAAHVEGFPVAEAVGGDAGCQILDAIRTTLAQTGATPPIRLPLALPFSPDAATFLTLLPHYRIAGCTEAIIVLVQPAL